MHIAVTPRVSLLALVLLAVLLPGAAPAASPERIVLEPATELAIPSNPAASVRLGDRLYFGAADPLYGNEVWVTDGSDAGTRRLTDLCPGSCSIVPANFVALGERVFFTVREEGSNALYALDGDAVSLVARFPGYLNQMVAAAGELFLLGSDLIEPGTTVILRSGGEPGDLRLLEYICGGPDSVYCNTTGLETLKDDLFYRKEGILRHLGPGGAPQDLLTLERFRLLAALAGGRFLFWGCLPVFGGCYVYNTDGTAAGTFQVAEDGSRSPGGIFSFASWHGLHYWVNWLGKLVRSDGTVAGTVDLAIPAESLVGATPSHLFYVRYGSAAQGARVHALAGDGGDVELLDFDPEMLGIAGDSIFLAAGQALYVSDGSVAGTRRLADLTAAHLAFPGQTLGNRLYASAYRPSAPSRSATLWRFDAQGNAQPFPGRSAPVGDDVRPLTLGDGQLAAFEDYSRQLWRVDAATLAAAPVSGPGLYPLAAAGGKLMLFSYPRSYYLLTSAGLEPLPIEPDSNFVASTDGTFFWGEVDPGQKLWAGDGTPAGSREIFDFAPDWAPSGCSYHCPPLHPSDLLANGDDIYLVAPAGTGDPESDVAVWVYHHGSGRLDRLKTFYSSVITGHLVSLPVAGKVVFAMDVTPMDPLEGHQELWVTDGTPAGTRQIVSGELGIGRFVLLGSVGERVFFTDDYSPDRLYSSDLGAGGVHLLLDQPGLSVDRGPTATAGDHFFFGAYTWELGAEPWTSDGTPAGTRALDLRAGPLGSGPTSMLAVGERLIFSADRGDFGLELYESDGTLEGTRLLADVAPGAAPSSPGNLAAIGDRIFFTADDGLGGRGLWAFDLPPVASPSCPADRLCLRGGRFEVSVEAGAAGLEGRRVLASAESGVFSFFTPDNWELLVKVLDGCGLNQRFWVYSAAATDVPYTLTIVDRATGERRIYRHAGGRPAEPDLDAEGFATCAAAPPPAAYSAVVPAAPLATRCADDVTAFCFGPGGRFRVRAEWQTAEHSAAARPDPYGSADSGLFTFFSPSNWELMVKVLDGCALNGHHWVYLAGTTDVGWELTVEDRATGAVRRYRNPLGTASPAITDGEAFTGCP